MTRVLIVDDEIDTLNLLRMILELSGYQAVTTLNSVDAITLAELEHPDCVLLDIMMPQLDGFTLCKMMRLHPSTAHLPIVFVTAYSALDLEERRVDAGADMVLPKPIGMDALITTVQEAISRRNAPQPLPLSASATPPSGAEITPPPAPAAPSLIPTSPAAATQTMTPVPTGPAPATTPIPTSPIPTSPIPTVPAPAQSPASTPSSVLPSAPTSPAAATQTSAAVSSTATPSADSAQTPPVASAPTATTPPTVPDKDGKTRLG
ncbi:MAG: response regulator [Anaerolinea sp.]|nr:response regulator [Anaerolinea sp.]